MKKWSIINIKKDVHKEYLDKENEYSNYVNVFRIFLFGICVWRYTFTANLENVSEEQKPNYFKK